MVYSTCSGWDLENIRSLNHAGAFLHAKIPPSILSTKAENMSLKIRGCAGGWETTCDARKKINIELVMIFQSRLLALYSLGMFGKTTPTFVSKFPPPKKWQQRNFGDSNMVLQLPVELRPSSPTNCQWHWVKSSPLASTVFQRVGSLPPRHRLHHAFNTDHLGMTARHRFVEELCHAPPERLPPVS